MVVCDGDDGGVMEMVVCAYIYMVVIPPSLQFPPSHHDSDGGAYNNIPGSMVGDDMNDRW